MSYGLFIMKIGGINVRFMLLLLFIFIMSVIHLKAEIVAVNGIRYSLSGANAIVSGVEKDNTNTTIIIPSSIMYDGLEYEINEIGPYAFLSDDRLIVGDATGEGLSGDYYGTQILNHVVLPPTIKRIRGYAFHNSKITHIIIPKSVEMFGSNPFDGCSMLRTIIYLGEKPPTNWVATSYTYVPSIRVYNKPKTSINNASIVEMITFNQTAFNYTGQVPTTTWNNNVEGYTASLSMSTLSGEVGSHEEWMPVTFTKDDETFSADVLYRYTIKPAKLTAKVNNVSREYGEENPQFSVSYSGFISGESESVLATQPTIYTTATKKSNVGDYPITISGGNATNYEFVYEPGVLTVTKAPLSAKINDATKVYGSSNPAFTIDYYGLKNNESAPAWTTRPTFQTDATQSSGVGQYPIKAVNGVPINYDLGEITAGTLNITPAQLTIKANDAVRQYYSDDPNFSYTCSGFVNGDNASVLTATPSLSTSATRTSNVGTYEIKVGDTSSPNYSISFVNGTLTITPRTLIASV